MNWLKHKAVDLWYPLLFFLFLATAPPLLSQDLLTRDEAVELTLKNNYGIQVARNNVEVAKNNTSIRNTGYLPTLTANTGSSYDLGGSTQEFGDGSKTSTSNAASWGGNASLNLNYLLFDQSRRATAGQLREILDLSNLELRQTIELNLIQLYSAYYEVARLSANLNVQAQTLAVSKRRLQRVQYQYEYGQGIRLDMLNAQVDVQRDSINYLNIRNQLANSRRNLRVIMGNTDEAVFEVDTTVVYDENLTWPQLLQQARDHNIDLLISRKNLDISQFDLKIINAGRLPSVDLRMSYDYLFQNNPDAATIIASNSRGLGLGVNLSWSIFDGGLRSVRKQNTRIAIENQLILQTQIEQELERDLANAWESYQNALFVLTAEQANLNTNQLNFDRTVEQFNIGQVTSVEFRQAQINLLNAATNYNTAKYDAKVIELQLIQLSGGLLAFDI